MMDRFRQQWSSAATPALLMRAVLVLALWLVPLTAVCGPSQKLWSEDLRYVDNGDGTITDTRSSLMWMKEDSYQRTGHWLNWKESQAHIAKMNESGFADYIDWQLPTLKELRTLYESDKVNSAQLGREMKIHIDPIFAKEGSGAWWSVETNGTWNAFGIVFNTGNRFSAARKSRSRKAVRAVRIIRDPSQVPTPPQQGKEH